MMLNSDRIELIRHRLGLTKIAFAKALDIDRKTLHNFEVGEGDLSDKTLTNLSNISGYPESFFRKGSFDLPNPDGVSFRSLRSLTASARDSAIAASALAFEIDDWVRERFELPAPSVLQVCNKTPEEAAAAVRAFWGIGERPIANMINVLESHGIRVFSLAEQTRHLDAYSLWRNKIPYIFLNTLKTAEHSRFDAAHELGHLVMHRHGGSAHTEAENEANAFASAFLMPTADLLAKLPQVRSLNDLISAKKRWGVSVAALNYALHKRTTIISDWNYRSFYIELSKRGRSNEPEPMIPETSQIWAKILKVLWSEKITLSNIADALFIPEKELNDLLFGITSSVSHKPNIKKGDLKIVQSPDI